MTEQIIWTKTPLKDAINKVTKDHQFKWRLREFATNDKEYWQGEPVKTGVKIEVYHPKRGWERFTIRDDYDFAHGESPSGKGYHVNVEGPSEKIAYCCNHRKGETTVQNYWDFISERVCVDGDEAAAQWYMNDKGK